eukprot:scaffold3543_cov88-Isochrysis_galbana.AAC.1
MCPRCLNGAPIRAGAPPIPPQIESNDALTSLSVPVLASVGESFKVRHTYTPLLPALAALPRVRSISALPRTRAPDYDYDSDGGVDLVGGYFYVRHPPPCFPHSLPAVCALGRSIRPPSRARVYVPPVPLNGALIRAPAVPPPQIWDNTALTRLSIPELTSVSGDFYVRHTHPPCFPHLLPAVCALSRSIRPPRARASMCLRCL